MMAKREQREKLAEVLSRMAPESCLLPGYDKALYKRACRNTAMAIKRYLRLNPLPTEMGPRDYALRKVLDHGVTIRNNWYRRLVRESALHA
jgi:hypothetical protein